MKDFSKETLLANFERDVWFDGEPEFIRNYGYLLHQIAGHLEIDPDEPGHENPVRYKMRIKVSVEKIEDTTNE